MTAPVSSSGGSASAQSGIFLALGGGIILSLNDLAIKALAATGYPLHQIVLVRALIGITLVLLVMAVSARGLAQIYSRRKKAHLLRVCIVVVSNMTYFVGLSLMPLADAVAIAFVSPLIVTALSALILGEAVGPRRWAAVAVGLLGVVVMTRPGSGMIQPAAVLVLISAVCYASSHIMTRQMRDTESAATLSFYVQLGFLAVSSIMGLMFGDGQMALAPDSTFEFLFRPWVLPPLADWWAFLATGLSVGIGGLMMSQAYRTTEAALVAPFEYIAIPMAILWGVLVFGTWPDHIAWLGIALICGAGLYTLWRETVRRKVSDVATPGSDL
ncbi:DMT family transporter [Xinfangfangia sp. CPCC 101601]|uniref:DMT family transporter n=1 Tax=Pseudogemmobacter lacusdianii TaxID=3069608 RepID=A0ABU0VYK6_9RHOB|nr:DMT family transporter [Xinfangfangia sp. CPCC 101601]MDQ2066836.1 DMT family transporter [Xinfangfangia sp. CPCC 101601]